MNISVEEIVGVGPSFSYKINVGNSFPVDSKSLMVFVNGN